MIQGERLLRDMPEGVTLIGVDQATYLICHPDDGYEVAGTGEVTVYRSVEDQRVYRRNAQFTLESPADTDAPPAEKSVSDV